MSKYKLLIRSDDLGYSEAVNYGLEKVLRFNMTKSVGLMVNMPSAIHGLKLIEDLDVCIGQHTNICVGKPISDPNTIKSLVQENGLFKTSKEYRSAKEDIVILDDAIKEVEAQYFQFKKLIGKDPEYFEGHAIRSANFIKALKIVADKYNLKFSGMANNNELMPVGNQMALRCTMKSMDEDYDAIKSIKDILNELRDDVANIYVCHPGYVDYDLLKSSSLTINRTKEVEMLCSEEIKDWFIKNDIELISYRDIGNN